MPSGFPNKKPIPSAPGDEMQQQAAPPLDPVMQRLTDLEQRVTDGDEEKTELRKEIARLKFIGRDPNKERLWEGMQGKDENIKFGTLPSFDGENPIIKSRIEGTSFVNAQDQMVDTQVVMGETMDGGKFKMDLMEYAQRKSGFSIPIRINDYLALKEKDKVIADLRHKFQRSTVYGTHKIDTVALLKEIKEKEADRTVNVTLSLDGGKSYTGATLDVPICVLNA